MEAVKIAFYKAHRAEVEAQRRAFVEAGGDEAEFVPAADAQELRLKDLFKEYRRRRDEFIASLDAEKEANLKIKLPIIEELKELVNSDAVSYTHLGCRRCLISRRCASWGFSRRWR